MGFLGEFYILSVGAAILTVGTEALAQETAPPSQLCEIHIFPGQGIGVVDATQVRTEQGVVGNMIRDNVLNLFRIKDPQAVQAFLADALPFEDQLTMLKSVNYPATLKAKGRKVVIHEKPTDEVTLSNFKKHSKTAKGASVCYSELVISGTYFEKSTMSKSLKTSYFYRDFERGEVPIRAVFKAAGTGISNFPPKNEAEVTAARQNVRRTVQNHFVTIMNTK